MKKTIAHKTIGALSTVYRSGIISPTMPHVRMVQAIKPLYMRNLWLELRLHLYFIVYKERGGHCERHPSAFLGRIRNGFDVIETRKAIINDPSGR